MLPTPSSTCLAEHTRIEDGDLWGPLDGLPMPRTQIRSGAEGDVGRWVDGWMDAYTDGWTDAGIDVPINIGLRGWRDGWTDE